MRFGGPFHDALRENQAEMVFLGIEMSESGRRSGACNAHTPRASVLRVPSREAHSGKKCVLLWQHELSGKKVCFGCPLMVHFVLGRRSRRSLSGSY